MSKAQTEYLGSRIVGWTTDEELSHPNFVGYDAVEVDNSNGQHLDLHKIPKGLEDWDYVWNHNTSELTSRLFKLSLRIARLYNLGGYEDPEMVEDQNSPWANSNTGQNNIQPNTYVFQQPDAQDKISDITDGDPLVTSLAKLSSIVGTRSYTGDPADNLDWKNVVNPGNDGYWVTEGTTITHNIDELDQALGGIDGFTGFTDWETDGGTVFWNAKNYKDANGVLRFSLSQNQELLNRSIGSRVVTDISHLLGTNNELESVARFLYDDTELNVTDYINRIVATIGSRNVGTAFPAVTVPINTYTTGVNAASSVAPSFPIGSNFTGLSLTGAINTLSDALGNRVIVDNGDAYPLTGLTGSGITTLLNSLNTAIGGRYFGDFGASSVVTTSGSSITEYIRALNTAVGNRVITNNVSHYALQGATNGLAITTYLNTLNNTIGSRAFTNNSSSDPWVLRSQNNTSISDIIETVGNAFGNRVITQSYVTNGTTMTEMVQALANRLDSIATTDTVTPANGATITSSRLNVTDLRAIQVTATGAVEMDSTLNVDGVFTNPGYDAIRLKVNELLPRYNYVCPTEHNSWSKVCTLQAHMGCAYQVGINYTVTSVIVNVLFQISVNHAGSNGCNLVLLNSGNYTQIEARLSNWDTNGNVTLEIREATGGVTDTRSANVTITPLNTIGTVTATYTTFTSGAGSTANTTLQTYPMTGNWGFLSETEKSNIATSATHSTRTDNPHNVTVTQIGAEPAFTKNAAFNKNFGVNANDVCQGNDARLSDARTPTAHDHTISQITDYTAYSLPISSGSVLGGVKIGSGVTVAGDGTISVSAPAATTIENITTASTNRSLVLVPNTTGGVEFSASVSNQITDISKQLPAGGIWTAQPIALSLSDSLSYLASSSTRIVGAGSGPTGNSSGILREFRAAYSDDGINWTPVNPDLASDSVTAYSSSPNDQYANSIGVGLVRTVYTPSGGSQVEKYGCYSGAGGVRIISTDGGVTWTQEALPTNIVSSTSLRLQSVIGVDDTTVFVGALDGGSTNLGLSTSTDGGQTFSTFVSADRPNTMRKCSSGVVTGYVWTGDNGDSGSLYIYRNSAWSTISGPSSWFAISTSPTDTVRRTRPGESASNGSRLIALNYGCHILNFNGVSGAAGIAYTDDWGATWQSTGFTGLPNTWTPFASIDYQNGTWFLYGVSGASYNNNISNNELYISRDGINWTKSASASGLSISTTKYFKDRFISVGNQVILYSIGQDTSSNLAGGVAAHSHAWNDITSKPSTFAPSAHALNSHDSVTLAQLNAVVSDNDLVGTDDTRLSDARTPTSHALNSHSSVTLAQLNAVVSDNDLVGTDDARLSDARTPTTHNHDTAYLSKTGNDTTTGTITAVGFNVSSDRRLKKDIAPIFSNAIEAVMALKPVEYRYIDGDGSLKLGFIAQDVQQVMPQAVNVNEEGMLSIDNNQILAVLVKAFQELAI